jgi:hypothetical protein
MEALNYDMVEERQWRDHIDGNHFRRDTTGKRAIKADINPN